MTLRELSQLIALGEGRHLEFKHRVPGAERIAKEVIAFANTGGGRLLLGVGDDGTVLGVRDAAEEEFALKEALALHSDPPVDFTTERVELTKKRDVIVVYVPASPERPHYLHHDGRKVAYVRVGDMSVEASREAIKLMRSHNDDSDVVFEFGDNEKALMRYLDSYGRITVEQFATLTDLPRWKASKTLVLLARSSILQHHADAQEDYFTLAWKAMDN